MKRYTDWRTLPDDPNRVGDEDYKPYSPPKEVDEDEAYERGREREWQEENRSRTTARADFLAWLNENGPWYRLPPQ